MRFTALGLALAASTSVLAAPAPQAAEPDPAPITTDDLEKALVPGVNIKLNCPSRSKEDQDQIVKELKYAMAASRNAAPKFTGRKVKTFYEAFISEELRNLDTTKDQLKGYYERMGTIADAGQTTYVMEVTCDNTSTFCKNPNFVAHMNDKKKVMNICNNFFDILEPTLDVIKDCKLPTTKYPDLVKLRRTRAHTLIHEFTHTSHTYGSSSVADDFGYGVKDCSDLAKGTFKRTPPKYPDPKPGKSPVCPDASDPTKEGLCDKNLSIDNADSVSMIVTGIFFTETCGREVPLGAATAAGDDEPMESEDEDEAPVSTLLPTSVAPTSPVVTSLPPSPTVVPSSSPVGMTVTVGTATFTAIP